MIRRLVMIVLVAVFALFLGTSSVSATTDGLRRGPAYSYDNLHLVVAPTHATTERGPPASYARHTDDADDHSLDDASARANRAKAPRAKNSGAGKSKTAAPTRTEPVKSKPSGGQIRSKTTTTKPNQSTRTATHPHTGKGSITNRAAANARRTADNVNDLASDSPTTNTAARACSFTGSTTVLMADGTKKAIEEVRVGDEVVATDPETGEQIAKRVEHVFVHDDTVVDLVVDGEVITTTEDHPFWSITDQRFERADELAPGEKVLGADGTVITVSGLELGTAREALAYNLSIDGIHTYHVGDRGILVHNESTCGRALWQITDAKSVTTKVVGKHKYSKQADGMWWSRDTAGHSESAWKVYREMPGGLKWYRDADKHKSDVGMIVRW